CSHLKPCYPGFCDGNGNCVCTNGFTGSTCLTLPNDNDNHPKIEQSTVEYAFLKRQQNNMTMYEFKVDASMSTGREIIWTNRREFNFLNYTFRALYKDDSDTLPEKPNYVLRYAIGIAQASITADHTKYGQGSVFGKTYNCPTATYQNPVVNEQMLCEAEEQNYNLRIDHRDRFQITFTAKTGGIRQLTPIGTANYNGHTSTKILDFNFDLWQQGGLPFHCSNDSSCTSNEKPLHIANDVTRDPFTITWNGWKDLLSGVSRYAWEVYKLQPRYDGNLTEPVQEIDGPVPVPLIIRALNHSNSIAYPTYTPPGPGVYSIILEVGDKANNTVYARRFVLYDPSSTVTTNSTHPMYVSSANETNGNRWQTSINNGNNGKTLIHVIWTGHFENKVHADGHFLRQVLPFSHVLSDMSINRIDYKNIPTRLDDYEGKMTRNGTPNKRGIVKFEIASSNSNDSSPTAWNNVPLTDSFMLEQPSVQDGGLVKIWVRATDILGDQLVDFTYVFFDSTPPSFTRTTEVTKNVGNNPMDFTSRFTIYAKDQESAIVKVAYTVVANSSGRVVHTGVTHNPKRTPVYCSVRSCDELTSTTGEYYERRIHVDISNCDLMVDEQDLATETLDITFEVFNGALSSVSETIQLSDLTSLRGVNQYYGPMNITANRRGSSGARVTWYLAPSCYPRYGLMLFVSDRVNGTYWEDMQSFKIHKDAEHQDITFRNPNYNFNISMLTKYGTNENDLIMSPRTFARTLLYVPVPEKQTGSNAGVIGGSVVGVLILIALVVLIIVLWRTGRWKRVPVIKKLSYRKEDHKTKFLDLESSVKTVTKNPYSNPGYNNRCPSMDFDQDIYVYGETATDSSWIIPRKTITLEEEIAKGRFAILYKARYSSDTVVAKTLKSDHTELDELSMRAKSNFFIELQQEKGRNGHPNLLQFIGLVEDDGFGPFMILEYCEKGPMNTYLSNNKNKVDDDMHERLFKFSYDICKGMNYLASKGHVHRRLAARNVLLTFTLQAKVAGFGPAPPETDDDSNQKQGRIPIKWMAPECLQSNKYSTEKSDVWSYGIVLWEIFSMGETPYPGIRSNDVSAKLRKGERMKKPEHADQTFYKLMKDCWEYEESKRPNFEHIQDELDGMFKSDGGDDYYYDRNGIYDNRTN
ncbi:hypothetical protein FSP39_022224, partial [Pinctada imbricata]